MLPGLGGRVCVGDGRCERITRADAAWIASPPGSQQAPSPYPQREEVTCLVAWREVGLGHTDSASIVGIPGRLVRDAPSLPGCPQPPRGVVLISACGRH